MKYLLGPLLAWILTLDPYPSTLLAQPPARAVDLFSDITLASFEPATYDIDSSANAIYLFDRGEVNFDAGYRGSRSYSTIFERHARFRILNNNGLSLATFGISTAHRPSGYDVTVEDIRATVYNLEDGRVVATKLDKSGVFKDKTGKYVVDKIAFPNVRVGSIVDFSYRIVYPGFGFIPAWDFQGDYPVLWSQFEVSIPTLFDYFVKSQGYRPFNTDTTLYEQTSFPVAFGVARGIWSGPVIHRIWVLQDVTALEKREPYTTTLRNHVQKVQFQLSRISMDGYEKNYHNSWEQLTSELLKSENFGDALTDRNRWMDDALSKVSPKGDVSLAAAQKLYAYIRDQFTSTAEALILSQPIKKTWEEKKGNVADLNLLLTAVLRHQGFDASPVILSTRSHGYPMDVFPILADYNYVITSLRIEGKEYLLDATMPTLGFGQLPERCYNGRAHGIDSSHAIYPLLPDSITERRTTNVFLGNDDNGAVSGSYHRTMGIFESMNERNRLRKTTPEEFFENLRKTLGGSKQMTAHGFDSLSRLEMPLSWHYDMNYHFTSKTVYFYPIMHERISNNPLPGPERHYPVEMPFRIDNNYVLRMEIPKGYVVETLPRSARYTLEDGGGYYEYLIESDGQAINFRMRLQINRTNFPVSQYKGLREFYSLIIEKEKEQIVFKKSS